MQINFNSEMIPKYDVQTSEFQAFLDMIKVINSNQPI